MDVVVAQEHPHLGLGPTDQSSQGADIVSGLYVETKTEDIAVSGFQWEVDLNLTGISCLAVSD